MTVSGNNAEPGVPDRLRCHRVPLGPDDHRRQHDRQRRRPVQQGTATLTDVTVSGNSASSRGGGLVNFGTATLTNCTISGNSAQAGAGIYNTGTITMADDAVSGNSATNGSGGCLVEPTGWCSHSDRLHGPL